MTILRRRAIPLAGLGAGVVFGILAADAWNPGVDPSIVVADIAVGWAFIGGGTAAWLGRPASASGRLMVAVGVAWFAGTLLPALEFLHRGPLVHLLATYPTGRFAIRASTLGGRLRLVAVAVTYGLSLTRFGGSTIAGLVLGVALVWVAADAFLGRPGSIRRRRSTAGLTAAAIGAVVVAGTLARLTGGPLPGTLLAYDAVLALAAVVLAADVLAGRWAEALVAQVVVDLGDAAQAGSVRDRLARAIGDPSLRVGYTVDGSPGAFVDEAGQPIARPLPADGWVVTPLAMGGRQIGFIGHDPAILDDPRLVATISAAAELAISNSAMQAQVRARVAEVKASRQRLVLTGDTQRRRLEERLRAGAARRLDRVTELVREVRPEGLPLTAHVAELLQDLYRARLELADFARGVHPATLTTGGLAAALDELVGRTPFPIDVTIDVDRDDPLTESTVYFVCTEAVANATRHASGSRIQIDLRARSGWWNLTIRDNGGGGARLGPRGGLRGLADRVEALGGTFAVMSAPGRGTRIEASIPDRRGQAAAALAGRPPRAVSGGQSR